MKRHLESYLRASILLHLLTPDEANSIYSCRARHHSPHAIFDGAIRAARAALRKEPAVAVALHQAVIIGQLLMTKAVPLRRLRDIELGHLRHGPSGRVRYIILPCTSASPDLPIDIPVSEQGSDTLAEHVASFRVVHLAAGRSKYLLVGPRDRRLSLVQIRERLGLLPDPLRRRISARD